MGRRIVTTGRGGTGKTTFTALAAKYLERPILLIDIDPDQSLADMLGVDLEKEGVRTVLDILYDIQKQEGYENLSDMPLPEKIQYLFNTECIYESEEFDLISLGVKWTEGCYCAPNNLIRAIIPKLARNYANTLIDAPAGLEHLNRNVTSEVDDMFIVLDPSMKSLKNIERIQLLAKEVGISYQNFYMVANYRFNDDLEKRIPSRNGAYLGRVDLDTAVEKFNLDGKSLLELPDDSPAAMSVKQILEKAGYQTR
ncbi:MAG: AAA family ATPase [Dehalococcoidia bacterium]|nr:MAG: AAA family ATPase [Dehalococcoidia bacterium]